MYGMGATVLPLPLKEGESSPHARMQTEKQGEFAMEPVELLARALCRQYNRGFEDATDDNPYGGEESAPGQEKYLDDLVDQNWREWVSEAEALMLSWAPSQQQ